MTGTSPGADRAGPVDAVGAMRHHCCDGMRTHVQAITEPAALVAGDRAVLYDLVFGEYCLAGEGTALGAEVLAYCPWCGVDLPPSKREQWFSELRRLGLDPDDPRLDERFRSDAWWRGPFAPPAARRADGGHGEPGTAWP